MSNSGGGSSGECGGAAIGNSDGVSEGGCDGAAMKLLLLTVELVMDVSSVDSLI